MIRVDFGWFGGSSFFGFEGKASLAIECAGGIDLLLRHGSDACLARLWLMYRLKGNARLPSARGARLFVETAIR